MRLINEYSSEPEAYIDQGFLRSNGIDAQVDSEAISSIFPGSTAGGYALYVPEDQYDHALELLRSRR